MLSIVQKQIKYRRRAARPAADLHFDSATKRGEGNSADVRNRAPVSGNAPRTKNRNSGRNETGSAAFKVAAVFLSIGFAVGGAGSQYPLLELLVELAGIAVLAWLAATRAWVGLGPTAQLGLASAGLLLLLPLAQLVPLPPEVWAQLPGRERSRELLQLIGSADAWMPLSLDREATWRSLLALVPGFAAFALGLVLGPSSRRRLSVLAVGFAALSAIVGALQVASGGALALWATAHEEWATGLFTNRNHQALFVNLAILLAGATARGERKARVSPAAVALIALFVAATVATGSRTGAALLLLSVPIGLALAFGLNARRAWVPVALAAPALAAVLLGTSAGEVLLHRFGSGEDARLLYWSDLWVAIAQSWPVGTGFGTFAPVFQTVESLSLVGPMSVNPAHNDYLELALEGGVAAVLSVLAVVGVLAFAAVRAGRSGAGRPLAIAAAAGVALLLLHSMVDYPLRMLSLSMLFGWLASLLFPPPLRPVARIKPRLLPLAVAAVLAVQAGAMHLATHAVRSGDVRVAALLAPRSADAASWLALIRLKHGDARGAARAARTALSVSPIEPRAISALALAEQGSGRSDRAARLMDLAASAGWRDPVAQAWILDAAMAAGEPDVAAQRADALLRQGLFVPQAQSRLRELTSSADGRRAVADRLAEEPHWRRAFLTSLSGLTDEQRGNHAELLTMMRSRGLRLTPEEDAARR